MQKLEHDVALKINGCDSIVMDGPDARKLADAVYQVIQGKAAIFGDEGYLYKPELNEHTVRECAKKVWAMQPADDLEPEALRIAIKNENILIYYRLLKMIDPELSLQSAIRQYKEMS